MNFYNENDPFVADWLRELIKSDVLAPGVVDERSVEDIKPEELSEYTQCHFFAGIGVWSYALRRAGFPDNRRVWTGSCPCQPFSAAGKRKGVADERHLWPSWFWLIKQSKPDTIFGEQVANKDGIAWLDTVASDLEGQNYSCGACITCAASFSAPFPRHRIYFVGLPIRERFSRPKHDFRTLSGAAETPKRRDNSIFNSWRQLETRPCTIPNLDGTPLWLAREFLRGYGNALVSTQAQAFIESYLESE